MVKLLSLQAYNFKKLKLEEPLVFPEGITLISGLNESGKSSILDAVLYAFYGRVIRPPPERGRTRNEDIIAYGASEATVTLEFAIGDRKFKVTRRIYRTRPTRANLDEILENGQLRPLATTQEKVTEQIEQLLGGISFNEMVSSNVVAQKELDKLIQLRKDDRRKVINVFLNLESFNLVHEALDEDRKNIEGTSGRVGQIPLERQKLQSIKSELEEFRRKQGEQKKFTGEISTLEGEHKKVSEELESVSSLHKLLDDYKQTLEEKQKLQNQIDGEKRLLDSHLKQIDALNDEVEKYSLEMPYFDFNQAHPLASKIESRQGQPGGFHVLGELVGPPVLERKIEQLGSRLPRDIHGLQLEALRKGIKRPIWPYLLGISISFAAAFLAFLFGSIVAAAILALAGLMLIVPLALGISKISRIAEASTLVGQLEYWGGRLDAVRQQLRTLPTGENLQNLEGELKVLEQQAKQIVLPELPSDIKFSKELLHAKAGLKDDLNNKLTAKKTMTEEKGKRLSDVLGYLEQHKDVESRFSEQESVIKALESELSVVKKALEGVQKTAETLRNRVRPGVQAYMSHILPALTSGRYKAARLDEDYNLEVWDPDAGEYRAKEVFSGGTEDQFLLAMRLSFALALLPEVKGQKPEFVFLDEPLGSSDEIRRSGIIEFLNYELSHKFKQVFLISNVGGLEAEIPAVITLEDGRAKSVQMTSRVEAMPRQF